MKRCSTSNTPIPALPMDFVTGKTPGVPCLLANFCSAPSLCLRSHLQPLVPAQPITVERLLPLANTHLQEAASLKSGWGVSFPLHPFTLFGLLSCLHDGLFLFPNDNHGTILSSAWANAAHAVPELAIVKAPKDAGIARAGVEDNRRSIMCRTQYVPR